MAVGCLALQSADGQTGPVNGMRPADVRTHAIVDATVVVEPGTTIEHATIVVRDGVIEAVGADVAVPDEARIWSGTGFTVYPGLVDAAVLIELADRPETGGAHWNRRVHPQRRMADEPTPGEKVRSELREMGFAAAGFYPDSGVIRGSGVVLALAEEPEHVLAYDDRAAMGMGFDHGGGFRSATYPGSLIGAIALVRQSLYDAQWHAACRRVWAEHPDANEPPVRADALVALGDAAAGRQPILFEVSDELNALRAARLTREFDLDMMLLGSGTEFRRLDELVATELPLIVPLKYPESPVVGSLRGSDRVSLRALMTWEQAPTNVGRLLDAGATVALTTHGLEKRSEFPAALRRAIKHGLAEDDALAALTTTPARLLGLSHVLGTVEPGKAANLVVVDGSLFEKGSTIRATWINGRRHELEPDPTSVLVGGCTLQTDGGRTLAVEIDTDEQTVTFESEEGRRIKAKKVEVQSDQLSFMVDGRVFEADGFVRLAGVIIDGVVRGSGEMPDGSRFGFTITENELEGTTVERVDEVSGAWTLKLADRSALGGAAVELDVELDAEWRATGSIRVDDAQTAIAEGHFDPATSELVLSFEQAGSLLDGVQTELFATVEDKQLSGVIAGLDEELAITGYHEDADDPLDELPPDLLVAPLGAFGRPAPPESQRVLVTGATIWTCGPDGVIEEGELYVEDGRIAAVGRRVGPVPPDTLVIDAAGKHVTPGLIDCHSHTGIDGGVNEWTQANTAEVRIGDAIDPDDVNWYRQLAGGLTVANQLHGSANPIGGQNSVVKLKWGQPADAMRIDDAIGGIKFALGENVKRTEGRYPDSRMGVETFIRDAFTSAVEYQTEWNRYLALPSETRGRTYPPRRDLELDALVEIIEGERLVHCHSYRQDEILMLVRIAEMFGFTIGTFQHVLEGYKVAEAIAAHGAGASSFSDWWSYKMEVMDAIPYNGALMSEVGVVVSFNSDSNELARRMNTEASKAVRYGGMEPDEALRLVTINPARQLRIDHRTGSLEVDRDADFVIWSDDPLSSYARCEQTWIEGACYFDIAEDRALRAEAERERQRLIQRALAAAPKSRDSGRGGPDGARGERRGRPTRLLHRMVEARRDWMAEQVRRGADPEEIRPGDCGCQDATWWEWAFRMEAER